MPKFSAVNSSVEISRVSLMPIEESTILKELPKARRCHLKGRMLVLKKLDLDENGANNKMSPRD